MEARRYSERYTREADELNERETRSRAEGQPIDDLQIRRMSSFLKSYGEMRKGEEFVMREVRSRGRERVRFLVGGALLVLALLMAPVAWRRLRSATVVR